MQIDLSRFKDTYFEEATDHVATIESSLLNLEERGGDREVLDAIFRAAHSVKGGSGVFGLTAIGEFTHALESVLDRLREGEIACTRDLIDLLLQANDVLRGLLASARTGVAEPGEREAVLVSLGEVLKGATAAEAAADATAAVVAVAAAATEAVEVSPASDAVTRGAAGGAVTVPRWRVHFIPNKDLFRQGLDPLVLFRDLAEVSRILRVTLHEDALPDHDTFDAESCYLGWTFEVETAGGEGPLRDVFLFAEDDAVLEITPVVDAPVPQAAPAAPAVDGTAAAPGALVTPAPATPAPEERRLGQRRVLADRRPAAENASIRVATEKVDRLIDLVGEVVISQSMVANIIDTFSEEKLLTLRDAVGVLARNTRELQERIMGIRMMPVGGVFARFPRVVHDIAGALGKDIQVVFEGEETELDKGVIEQIGDPLTHMVRNAADHGIELPADRAAAGKPAQGTIRLSAFTRGGNVVIEVADDGKGLDTERIRAKALSQGLISEHETLSDEQVNALIFAPGFSTADQVSSLSGRGVGMDVVRRNVQALNGTVAVESKPGKGSLCRITLPLTLAILDGQSLTVGGGQYVLPITSIVESLRPRPQDVQVVVGRGEVVLVRGEAVPLVRLHRLFGVPTDRTDPCTGIVVLVEHDGQRAALLGEELLGQQQVVIKSLDTHYRRTDGVMGATIMGDGSVALILDVPGLLRLAGQGRRVAESAA
ncbi:chemotaxis protein CheA [Luteitalea sp. TBR-22]|uniref:chemotaxis protein CheA n=1 Tax=Luteitalea sp. TBR-22 TaxID=2802971 RepID=UPI001AF82380|nr:chemotaxis protein CheA [Luteitalea sp. TBR-22]BCS31895.1 chemotaxis protein CheA [Luteitalea sp. TBR-22]